MPQNKTSENFSSLQPWRMAPGEREDFLAWFLDAPLASDDAVLRLRERTGRRGHAQGLDHDRWLVYDAEGIAWAKREGFRPVLGMIGRGYEQGRHVLREVVSREAFVDFYASVQRDLWAAQRSHAREMDAPLHKRLGGGFVGVGAYTDDVRIDVAYREVPWPTQRRGAATVNVIDIPPIREVRSLSLVGELAWAMFEKLVRAKSRVRCPYCNRVELFRDPRPRKICGRPDCRARYVRQYQVEHESKEDIARRVQEHRARKGGQGGKARKR